MSALVAVLQILTALGMAGYWLIWFNTRHDEPWLPAGYLEHERVFVWPDSVTAVLLLVSAIGSLSGWSGSAVTSYVAAGMLLFLSIIDTAYFVQHGMLRRDRGGAGNGFILLATAGVAVASIAQHARDGLG